MHQNIIRYFGSSISYAIWMKMIKSKCLLGIQTKYKRVLPLTQSFHTNPSSKEGSCEAWMLMALTFVFAGPRRSDILRVLLCLDQQSELNNSQFYVQNPAFLEFACSQPFITANNWPRPTHSVDDFEKSFCRAIRGNLHVALQAWNLCLLRMPMFVAKWLINFTLGLCWIHLKIPRNLGITWSLIVGFA